jgi:hypothetical protein
MKKATPGQEQSGEQSIEKLEVRHFEPRYRAEDYVVQIMMIEPPSHFEARIMDISGRGLRLRVPLQLAAGDSISILLRNLVVNAKVRYCVENEIGGLDAGVQICAIHDRPSEPKGE